MPGTQTECIHYNYIFTIDAIFFNSKDHKDGETTTLTGFEPAITRPKLPIHDVYIGGATPTTTEDDLRVYLLKIGITPESIMSIECISSGDPQSSSFRVKICDTSILRHGVQYSKFQSWNHH